MSISHQPSKLLQPIGMVKSHIFIVRFQCYPDVVRSSPGDASPSLPLREDSPSSPLSDVAGSLRFFYISAPKPHSMAVRSHGYDVGQADGD